MNTNGPTARSTSEHPESPVSGEAHAMSNSPITLSLALHENLRFMTIEVETLLTDVAKTLQAAARSSDRPRSKLAFARREDYIDNLERLIEASIFERSPSRDRSSAFDSSARAVHIVAINLERIADFAINILGQLEHLHDPRVLADFDTTAYFREIHGALELVDQAVSGDDLHVGLEICSAEVRIDELYSQTFQSVMQALRTAPHPDDYVTVLFIFRYLERIGDALQNIGEAGLLRVTGQRIKVSDYVALDRSVDESELDFSASRADYQSIWGTRSGARIGKITGPADAARSSGPLRAIFKEGQLEKVELERRGIARWTEVAPGIPPRILGFREHGEKASVLLEFIQGPTLQQLVINGTEQELATAMSMLTQTLERCWQLSLSDSPSRASFVAQLVGRLRAILAVHPEFSREGDKIAGVELPSLQSLLERCRPLDHQLQAPLSVLLHGDFNTDNVIIDFKAGRVRFIDLHRAEQSDPTQDLTVFIVSNLRLPTLEVHTRARVDAVNHELMRFARKWARAHDDRSFEARIALGLARSLATSTRFALNQKLASAMFRRSVYLLRRLSELTHDQRALEDFQLDLDLLSLPSE